MSVEPFWVQVNESTLRQGDYLPGCLVPIPVFDPTNFGKNSEIQDVQIEVNELDLIVLTQSCDLDNKKVAQVVLCAIYHISEFEENNEAFKKKGKWNEVLRGRTEGLHLLASPTNPDNNKESLVVNFREIQTLPYEYVLKHASNLNDRWRLKSPYLEHFSQAFARLFMRVGLPSAIPPF
ncbi:hypothetical protein Osc7112_3962 [Oscillatoria nigro-viridis PCC 7112]|uniref:Uncharacterized protein n=1 Tax=Phormidium nigroviride PCC 7112 TaxID=179408 RepID=K9VL91_9CYAN|nr:hypothetical protein [Oscillatoria nigro-viridis]AFZ08299.1 hypothetical protein Osc7112_3962 [Oscillatoria nigro-viridis PCC 7112]